MQYNDHIIKLSISANITVHSVKRTAQREQRNTKEAREEWGEGKRGTLRRAAECETKQNDKQVADLAVGVAVAVAVDVRFAVAVNVAGVRVAFVGCPNITEPLAGHIRDEIPMCALLLSLRLKMP